MGSTLLERIPRALRAPAVRLTEFWELRRIPASVRAAPAVRGEFAQANSNASGGPPLGGGGSRAGFPLEKTRGGVPGWGTPARTVCAPRPPRKRGHKLEHQSAPRSSHPDGSRGPFPRFRGGAPQLYSIWLLWKKCLFFFWRRAPPQKTTRGGPGGAEPPRLNGSAQRRIPGGFSPDPSLPRARPESPYGSVKVDRDIRCNSARARAGAELQRISRALAQKSAHVRFFQNAPWRVDGIPGGGFHG